jgi:hypothetical protein
LFDYDLDAVNDPTCGTYDPRILELASYAQIPFVTTLVPSFNSDNNSIESFKQGYNKTIALLRSYNILE